MAELLQKIRIKAGLSQSEVAERIGLSSKTKDSYISHLEKGRLKNPALGLILLYLRACGSSCLNMKNFYLLKFRTMHQDADKRLKAILAKNPEYKKEFEATFKLKNDPRITRVGRFLRPYSLDEFPQIFNILRGEMSWVGPRPIVVEEVPYYKDYSLLMFRVVPGATGLWQISGRCDTRYQKRVELDTHYAKTWSFLNDIKILFKTIPAVYPNEGPTNPIH